MANVIKVTDKKGTFVGGAAARRKIGHKIQNPMVREKLKSVVGRHVHPQERMMAAILRSLPRDILKSYNFPFYREQLQTEMCQRVELPKLAPLKSVYSSMNEHNLIHAAMVLEEARYIIAQSLFRRWGQDRQPPDNGIEMELVSNEKMSGSGHLVYFFQAKKDLPTSIKSDLRSGSVVELMPLDSRSIESMVLGNVVRYSRKGVVDLDEVHLDREIAVMVYNECGEKFNSGIRLIVLQSLLNLTRQFDVCTNGNNDLNGEILGKRGPKRIHIKFPDNYDQSYDHSFEEEKKEVDSEDRSGKSSVGSSVDSPDDSPRSSSEDSGDDDEIEIIELSDSDNADTIVKVEKTNDSEEDDNAVAACHIKTEETVERVRATAPVKMESCVKNECDLPVIKREETTEHLSYSAVSVKREAGNDGDEAHESEECRETSNALMKTEACPDQGNKSGERVENGIATMNCNKVNEVGKAASEKTKVFNKPSAKDESLGKIATETLNDEEVLDEDEQALKDSRYHVPRLNQAQKKAADAFLNARHERISIVQGPPGTGKTTLLVSVICRYLYKAKIDSNKKSKRLLVSAPTNKAVTVLAVRVLDAIRDDADTCAVLIGDQERLLADNHSFLRRYFVYTWRNAMVEDWERIAKDLTNGRTREAVFFSAWAKRRLHDIRKQVKYLIDDDLRLVMSNVEKGFQQLEESRCDVSALTGEIRELVKHIKKWDEREIVETLLAEANLIFCTLSSAGAQVMKETVAMDDAIVDEAAAATGPELCTGLWLVNNRLLLVGDPNQLPAMVHSDYGKQNGLDKSLQDRLMNDCGFEYTMLDIQYRMKPEISTFPFKTFYAGNVSDGENVVAFSYQPDASLLDCKPYNFLQVQAEERQDVFGSWYNIPESDCVVSLLQDLKNRSRHIGDEWSSIDRVRVITFYQAQVNEIKKRLHRSGLHNVVVSTVDSSQGCEADLIIISFVRNNRVGFLSDYRRLNVALTRAKHQLVCVGNVKALAAMTSDKAQVVSNLAKDAISRNCVFTSYRPDLQPPRRNTGQQKRSNANIYNSRGNNSRGNNSRDNNSRGNNSPPDGESKGQKAPARDSNWKNRNFAQGQKRKAWNNNNSQKKTKHAA